MLFYLALTFLLLPLSYIIYCSYCLLRNYITAREIGIPIVILPIDCGNPLWQSVDQKLIPLFKKLPFGNGNFTRFNWRGWELRDRSHAHEEFGPAFVFVTPGKIWLQLGDPEAVAEVYQRRDDFLRPLELLNMLNVFGPNMSTCEGATWQRHRKVTAACFNDRANVDVWAEAVRQATEMLDYWEGQKAINTIADDSRTLSLHVMSSAGFGKSFPFQATEKSNSDNDSSEYKSALQLILDNCIWVMALGRKNLSYSFLPDHLRNVHAACESFQSYMTQTYEAEKQNLLAGGQVKNNLMTSLVRASQDVIDAGVDSQSPDGIGLTEREIYGNMFVFNFAGHDTTSHVLTFALLLLTTRPDIQEWIGEELDNVFGSRKVSESSFTEDFPKLPRCLAIMYETLRLYNPVGLIKILAQPQTLKIGSKTYLIPAGAVVIPSYSALHTDPKYWGSNSLVWDPRRWILPPSPSSSSETLLTFPRESTPFLAWSNGLQKCPGRKFSQVEFVAVMAGLFRDAKVRPVLQVGESEAEARLRIDTLIKEETGMRLLLQVLSPEKAVVRWEKR